MGVTVMTSSIADASTIPKILEIQMVQNLVIAGGCNIIALRNPQIKFKSIIWSMIKIQKWNKLKTKYAVWNHSWRLHYLLWKINDFKFL